MVLLTITPCIIAALKCVNEISPQVIGSDSSAQFDRIRRESLISEGHGTTEVVTALKPEESGEESQRFDTKISSENDITDLLPNLEEPDLASPQIGNPISHRQIIYLSRALKSRSQNLYRLESLLHGSSIYHTPPPPKPEPSPEYKALMARLRQGEEARKYAQMISSSYSQNKSLSNYPAASAAYAFSSNHLSSSDDDEMTYSDINRQMALIFNVLLSVVASAAAIWIAARWWSTSMRLAVSMCGSVIVAIAEVVVYTGYLRRLNEAKAKEKAIKEVKEVVKTWSLGPDKKEENEPPAAPIKINETVTTEQTKVRRRK